ncbi:hypothetical protein DL98DRAFT_148992 [Cadophora sp. DSE1049]|nr:hypothetical protein DL98DRAFT_148992 [Cadophora sp. DSE1049]
MDREPRYLRSPPESQQFNEKQQGSRRDDNVFGKLSTDDIARPRAVNDGRKRTTLACQECRYRKVKCDGIKPMCGSCRRRGRQFTCSYLVSPEEKARNIFGYVDQLEKTLLDFQKEKQDILTSNDETRLFTQASPSGVSTTSYNHPDGSSSGDQHASRKRRRSETASQFKGVPSGRRSQHEGPLSSDGSPVQASSAFDSTSTDHFMEKVQRVSMNADQSTSPPMDDRSVSGTSGYFRDNFEEQVAKKPSILSRADDYGKSMRSRHTMQTLLTAYWDRVHILHPILHRPTWPGKQKAEVFVHGFTTTLDPSNSSTVATIMTNLVFALGALYSPGFTTAHALNTSEAFFLSAKEALTLDLLETPTVELAQTLLLMTHYVVERCIHQRGHLHASLLYLSLAIRVCTALGFHEDSGASKGPLTREIGRRIWWECIYTDMLEHFLTSPMPPFLPL